MTFPFAFLPFAPPLLLPWTQNSLDAIKNVEHCRAHLQHYNALGQTCLRAKVAKSHGGGYGDGKVERIEEVVREIEVGRRRGQVVVEVVVTASEEEDGLQD